MVVRKRLKIQGSALVFVTTTVKDWLPVFTMESAADSTITQFSETIQIFKVSLMGYVLMPSHLHALIGFSEVEKLSEFIQTFKSLSSRRIKQLKLAKYNNKLYANGMLSLWKPRFDDIIITSEKQFKIKLEYIHNNPVKAGLVAKASDWKYSSAADWYDNRQGLIKIEKNFNWL